VSIDDLPALNAALNATAATLLVIGWRFIRHGRVRAHRRTMIAAFITSALFFVSYITYHAIVGDKLFQGVGFVRTIYFSILVPHIILAAVIVPLAIVTLARGLRRDDVRHRRLAKITLPIWLFVSVTGVIIYVMLYRIDWAR
jgi:uncharacterized membrane protein YozB (DUF420 family)